MFGDFTRDTFDPDKPRTSVRRQQGRVLLDAEWNEQRDIDLNDARTTRRHVIGSSGGPIGDVGFEISVTGGGSGLEVGVGTYYVDGLRVSQSDSVAVPDLPEAAGSYAVYLDVWERSVNAIQDPELREVALGGPDTTVRTEVTHRVRLVPAPPGDAPHCSETFPAWDALAEGSTGEIQVQVDEAAATTDPCLVPETAGYKGLENQLIRIQIHDGNFDPTAPGGIGAATPTFKWARNNASLVASWSHQAGTIVNVDRLGPGGTDGLAAGRWVEFTNDDRDLAGEAGIMAQVDEVITGGIRLVVQPGLGAALVALEAAGDHPMLRVWDSPGTDDLVGDTWIDLTDGVSSDGLQVRFAAGRAWRSGDHWLVTARTAVLPATVDRQIDWPVDAADNPLGLPSAGPAHHVARLAVATLGGAGWTVTDCRREFAPLTDHVTFVSRGGDGQHAPGRHWLAAPLSVAASHGLHPLAGRDVGFEVTAGGGELSSSPPDVDGNPTGPTGASITVTTPATGVATVWWRLGPGDDPERPGDRFAEDADEAVTVALLDDTGSPTDLAVGFHARAVEPLMLVAAGGDGQIGWPGETLEIAPRARVSAGRRPAVGAHVEFEVVSRMDDGTALTEMQGGSIHATAGIVSTENWPSGSTTVRAVVETDADGVAQVQWRLGTDTGLPVQRLYAYLLDDDGARTSSYTIFTAHLSIAGEIRWDPCERLEPLLPELASPPTVQDALDLFCDLFVGAGTGWLVTDGSPDLPLNISSIVSIGEMPDVVIDLPHAFEPPPPSSRGDLMELSILARLGAHGLSQRVVLPGEVGSRRRGRGTRVTWSPADTIPNALRGLLDAERRELTVVVTLRPALFGRATMFAEWSGAFRVRA